MSFRVDNVPFWLKPFYLVWAYTMAIVMLTSMRLLRKLTRISFESKLPEPLDQAIYAIWHEDLIMYFSSFDKYAKPYWWLNHPVWYMKPIHLMLYRKGVKGIALGSSGHGGKGALVEVIEKLKNGHNTLVAIDGPSGPPKKAKVGVLEMSVESGLPIIPITYKTEKEWRLRGWDKKRIPHLFTQWEVVLGKPIYATRENYEASREALENALGK